MTAFSSFGIGRRPDWIAGKRPAARVWTGWNTSPVQAVRLDDILDPDTPLDLVKIDIEGLDHAAVAGLEGAICRWRPTILLEFNPGWIDVLGDRPDEVFHYYRSLGYGIHLLGGDALRLHREAGMPLDELLLDNLTISPAIEPKLIEHTRRIYFINLILTPTPDRPPTPRQ